MKFLKYLLVFLFLFSALTSVDSKEIFSSYPTFPERAVVYRPPTERYIGHYEWDKIANSMGPHVSMVNRNLFDRISDREELGFVGYHGCSQEYRIFQDIIRVVIEEIIGISIRDDFEFFRIPGDPQFSYNNLAEWGKSTMSSTHFLWMNYAIYGNHQYLGSSSYYYFTANSSAHKYNFANIIKPLFSRLEMDMETIGSLFDIGREFLGGGVIYQLFDMSHYDPRKLHYELADSHCSGFGSNLPFSKIIAGTSSSGFALENRMLMSNAYTLNPYSALVVKRFDSNEPEDVNTYMEKLRDAVRALHFSEEKTEIYRDELLLLWGNNVQ